VVRVRVSCPLNLRIREEETEEIDLC